MEGRPVTKTEAKKYVYRCVVDILDNGSENSWLTDDGRFSDADIDRVSEGFSELIRELVRRGGLND